MALWLLWLWVPLGLAEEETLLDTRLETSELRWTVHPEGEGQWEELSALDAELGAAVRTFEVCSGRGQNPAHNSRSPAHDSRNPAQNSQNPAHNSPNPAHNSRNPAHNSPNPAHNSRNPAHNSPNPAHNSRNPAQNGFSSAQNGFSPAQNSWSPAQNSWSPAQNSWSPAQNSWSPAQNSWLRSRWVRRGAATTVMAEIRFTVMACDGHGGTRGARGARGAPDTPGDTPRDTPGDTPGHTPGDTPGHDVRDTPMDTPGHDSKPVNLYGNDPKNDPKPINLHGNDPKNLNFYGNDTKPINLHGNNPKPIDLHGKVLEDLDLHGNNPKNLNFYGNNPKPIDLHGHDPKLIDLHGNDPKPIDLHGNKPEDFDLHGNNPKNLNFYGKDPKPIDLHGNNPKLLNFSRNYPKPIDLHGDYAKPINLHGDDPKLLNFSRNYPKPIDLHGNYAKPIDLHGNDRKLLHFSRNNPKPIDLHGNYPKTINLHGNYPKPIDLHGDDPKLLNFSINDPKPIDLHGNDPKPIDLRGNYTKPIDPHGDDPKPLSFSRNNPKPIDLHGNDPKPIDLHGNDSKPIDLHGDDPKPLNFSINNPNPAPPPPRGRRRRRAAARTCKETFSVFYHESDADTATATSPPWMENPYVKVDTVAAEHLTRRPGGAAGAPRGRVNRKVLRLGPLSRAGFYLAFQDLGACMALLSVRLFFRRCPAATARLARFPATVPAELVAPVPGVCVPGAVPAGEGEPLMYCREDGRWAEPPALGCVCGPGMEPGDGAGCRPCPPETFKAEAGGGRCRPCPPQSEAPSPGAPSCRCRPGFFRAPGEGPPERCSAPPSAPRALSARLNGSVVRLSWSPPRAGAERPDLRYSVGCRACPPARGAPPECGPCEPLAWAPPPQGLRTPAVSAAGLRPRVTYSFRVSARSGVSPPGPPEPPAAEINVTAGADVPPPVSDVVRVGGGPGGVTLAWPSPPQGPPGPPVLDYEVKFYEKLGGGEGPPQFLKVPRPRAELGGLRRGGLYGVRVRARSEGGYGDFGPETTVSATGSEGSRGGPGGVVAGAAVLGGLLVLALLGGALACRRRWRLRAEKQRRRPGGLGGKLYIDPLSYEEPEGALRDFATEIDAAHVTIHEVIGAGEFGEVWRGRLALPGQPEAEVAVKTLKGGAGERQRREFLREAARMGQFRHPNVVRLRGVVSTAGPPAMIVTEFLLHGALDAFLRGREGTLPTLQLVAMLRGIAAGMRYLAEAGFVHRDLAARNVLVDAHLVCKVSDFGLSRALGGARDSDPTYTSSLGGKIPIRWTAPEAIAFRTFTSASDVWSFGIVMWEVLSFGERPYWDMSNQDVINAVEQDYRLPPPPRCPAPLHRLMLQCWQRQRGARPTFPHLLRALDHLIRRPETLRPPAADPRSPAPSHLEPGRCEEPSGGAGLELLPRLRGEDLLRMGVAPGGRRPRVLEGAQSPPGPPKGDPQC